MILISLIRLTWIAPQVTALMIPKHHHWSNQSHKRKQSKQCKYGVKAIHPRKYNGKEDPWAFHRFMKEGVNYLKDARVKPKHYTYTLSQYLNGRAYNFYTQKVSQMEENWSLDEFFQSMFNYCFPSNYCIKMRSKLEKISQSVNQSVIEFVYELEELFNLIDNVLERNKVLKLWNGLHMELQHSLWRDRLHPEVLTWEEVVAQAETIEISRNVTMAVAINVTSCDLWCNQHNLWHHSDAIFHYSFPIILSKIVSHHYEMFITPFLYYITSYVYI